MQPSRGLGEICLWETNKIYFKSNKQSRSVYFSKTRSLMHVYLLRKLEKTFNIAILNDLISIFLYFQGLSSQWGVFLF